MNRERSRADTLFLDEFQGLFAYLFHLLARESQTNLEPFLNIGVICTRAQSLGRTPELRDFIKIKIQVWPNFQHNVIKPCGCKLSGPGALMGFKNDNASKTSDSVIKNSRELIYTIIGDFNSITLTYKN